MKWPIIRRVDDCSFPADGSCGQCGRDIRTDVEPQVVFTGASLVVNDEGDSIDVDGDLEIYSHVSYHSPRGDPNSRKVSVDVVEGLIGGQYDIYFCSITCLRFCLMELCDELQRRTEG